MWEILLPLVRAFLNAILLGLGGTLVTILAARFVTRLFSQWMSPFWSRFIGSLIGLGLAMWTVKIVLDSSGAAGLAVVIITAITGAFALGSSMLASDLVAGVSLFFARPYEVGHMVEVAEMEGKVMQISLFLTILESPEGDKIYIRNSDIVNHTITNYSARPGKFISVIIRLPTNQDLNLAINTLNKALVNFTPKLDDSKPQPTIQVESMDGGRFIIEIHAYVLDQFDTDEQKTRLFTLCVNSILEAGLTL